MVPIDIFVLVCRENPPADVETKYGTKDGNIRLMWIAVR